MILVIHHQKKSCDTQCVCIKYQERRRVCKEEKSPKNPYRIFSHHHHHHHLVCLFKHDEGDDESNWKKTMAASIKRNREKKRKTKAIIVFGLA